MSGGGGDEGVDLTAATSNWFSDVGGKLYAGATKLVDDLDKFDDQLGEQMENAAKAVVEKAAEAKSKLDEVGGVSNFIGVSGLNLISPRDTNGGSKTNASVKAKTLAKKHGLVKDGGQDLSKRFKKSKTTGLF